MVGATFAKEKVALHVCKFVYFNFKIQDNNKDRLFDFLEESYRKIKEYQNGNRSRGRENCKEPQKEF